MPANKHLLVCDLDNTLYDWVHYFVSSFYAMVDEVVRITNCDRERLLDDFRDVHQRFHDAEHPFALLETKTVRDLYPDLSLGELSRQLNSAFHAFNSCRRKSLRLHPTVLETLECLRASSVTLVAHTESNLYAVVDRLSRFNLQRYFARIYCRERAQADHPDPSRRWRRLENFPMEKVVELSRHQKKPSPSVLLEICANEGFSPECTAYAGDSVARDVLMAKKSNVYAIWAKYGAQHSEEEYSRLVRVSHWTENDIAWENEARATAMTVEPDFVAENAFCEVLTALGLSRDDDQCAHLTKRTLP